MPDMNPDESAPVDTESAPTTNGSKVAFVTIAAGLLLFGAGAVGHNIGEGAGNKAFDKERSQMQREVLVAQQETDKVVKERDSALKDAERWEGEYFAVLKQNNSRSTNPAPPVYLNPTPPQQQEKPQQQAPQNDSGPNPPYPAGSGKEWATMGPYGLQSTCTQASDSWPLNYTDCYQADGAWYFYGIRQAA